MSATNHPRGGPPSGGGLAGPLKGYSRISPLRAAVRMARRDVWRNRGRSALIAVMIALPVLATSTLSVVYRSDQRDPQDIVQAALGDESQALIFYQSGVRVSQGPNGIAGGSSGTGDPAVPKAQTEAQLRALLQSRISARDQLVSDVSLYGGARTIRFKGRRLSVDVREIDYTAADLKGLINQVSGRAATAAGEVVISRTLAHKDHVRVGDTLDFTPAPASAPRPLRVVGIVHGVSLIGERSAIGRPGALIPADRIDYVGQGDGGRAGVNWRVIGPDPVTWAQVKALNAVGGTVTSRAVVLRPPAVNPVDDEGPDPYSARARRTTAGITVVVVGLALLQIALLAGPAIAVGARRNQHGLAIIASAGAERRHLRAVVLASNGVIGVVAGTVAAGFGAALGAVVCLLMIRFDSSQLIRVDVHPLDLVGLAAVGGLTAVAAAVLPAWQASRLDVVAVLTGRRPRLGSRVRIPLIGLAVTAIGLVMAYLFSGRHSSFLAVAALALSEIGLIAATGAVVALAARAAARLPFSARFALRDAARQRSRTVPAVAAVLAAVAGATCALVYVASQAAQDERSYTAEAPLGTAVVRFDGHERAEPVDPAAVETAVRRYLPVAATARFQTMVQPSEESYTYLELVRPPQNECPSNLLTSVNEAQQRAFLADKRCSGDAGSYSGIGDLFDDGSAYPLLGGRDDATAVTALRSGRTLVRNPFLLWPDGTVHVSVRSDSESDTEESERILRTVALPATLITAPAPLIYPVYPPSAAKALGVKIDVQGVVVDTARMPTAAEEARASSAVEDLDAGQFSVERGYVDNFGIGLLALVIAAAVVGLGGTFTAVGLAAAESRSDIATLAAVGASPGVRRRLAAGQAGVIAGLGTGLGLLSGMTAGWVLVRMNQPRAGGMNLYWGSPWADTWRLELPWAHLLGIGIGIPLLAIAVGFLTTRSRLPLVRRLGQ
jgi:putative ABC transport system permease protein